MLDNYLKIFNKFWETKVNKIIKWNYCEDATNQYNSNKIRKQILTNAIKP